MFEITVQHHFCAAHSLRGYPGKCQNIHGHNFVVEARITGQQLDAVGILVDFKDVKAALGAIIEALDHQYLNDLPPFREVNPSSENLAKYFYDQLAPHLPAHVRLAEICLRETPSYAAIYRPPLA
ncbi:MAG: 6-carboxytetrahydropterin synthase QueD [Bryobacteraceae bacterium]|nr:6-carboxytetrahydropterin synthase QueD [Bryobacteraceae bacterium]